MGGVTPRRGEGPEGDEGGRGAGGRGNGGSRKVPGCRAKRLRMRQLIQQSNFAGRFKFLCDHIQFKRIKQVMDSVSYIEILFHNFRSYAGA